MRRPSPLGALALGALVACAKRDDPSVVRGPVQEAGSACPQSEAPRVVGSLAHEALVEVSGLTASAAHPGAFYTHNDSGDTARVFALGGDGAVLAELALTGVVATDFEDIGTGPCGADRCVYVADIGDNAGKRESVAIHAFVEPARFASGAVAVKTARFRYEDGPHNAEGLLVDPRDGAVYVLTKEKAGPSTLFAVPPQGGVATRRGQLTPPLGSNLVTSASFSPRGDRVAVRTYTHAFVYAVRGSEPLEASLARPPCVVTAPIEPQGEAVAFTANGRALRFASEGKAVPLYEVSLVDAAP
jgi:hypothetical protein